MARIDDARRHRFGRHLRRCADRTMAEVDLTGGTLPPAADRLLRAAWMFDRLRRDLRWASDVYVVERCRSMARFVDEGIDPASTTAAALQHVGDAWEEAARTTDADTPSRWLDLAPDWRTGEPGVRYAALVADVRGDVLELWLRRRRDDDARALALAHLAVRLDALRASAEANEEVALRRLATEVTGTGRAAGDPVVTHVVGDLAAAWDVTTMAAPT